jgi:hypothetical protein
MRFWNADIEEGQAAPRTIVASAETVRDAYARGRRDERARHRRSPLMIMAFSMAALVGCAMLVTSAFRGSFEGGGQLLDHQIVTAAEEAGPALKAAGQQAGKALRGQTTNNRVAVGG